MVGILFYEGSISCILVVSSYGTLVAFALISWWHKIIPKYFIPFLRCITRVFSCLYFRIWFPDWAASTTDIATEFMRESTFWLVFQHHSSRGLLGWPWRKTHNSCLSIRQSCISLEFLMVVLTYYGLFGNWVMRASENQWGVSCLQIWGFQTCFTINSEISGFWSLCFQIWNPWSEATAALLALMCVKTAAKDTSIISYSWGLWASNDPWNALRCIYYWSWVRAAIAVAISQKTLRGKAISLALIALRRWNVVWIPCASWRWGVTIVIRCNSLVAASCFQLMSTFRLARSQLAYMLWRTGSSPLDHGATWVFGTGVEIDTSWLILGGITDVLHMRPCFFLLYL